MASDFHILFVNRLTLISKRVWILIKDSWGFVLFTRVLSSEVPLAFSSMCAPWEKTFP